MCTWLVAALLLLPLGTELCESLPLYVLWLSSCALTSQVAGITRVHTVGGAVVVDSLGWFQLLRLCTRPWNTAVDSSELCWRAWFVT